MCTSTRRAASQPTSPETVRDHPEATNHPSEEQQPQPSSRQSNGCDAKGRFTANNPGGPGNPFARQVAALRAALVRRVTEEDIEQIASELVTQAKMGNLAATKLLFLYVLGKPTEVVNPDTLDIEEWQQLYQPLPQIMKELPHALASLPPETACNMVDTVQPFVGKELANQLRPTPEEIAQQANEAAIKVKEQQQGNAASPRVSDRLASAAKGSVNPTANGDKPPSANGGNGAGRSVVRSAATGCGQASSNGTDLPHSWDPAPSGNGGNGRAGGSQRSALRPSPS